MPLIVVVPIPNGSSTFSKVSLLQVAEKTVHDAHRVDVGADRQAVVVEAEQHRRRRPGRIDRREHAAEIDKAVSNPAGVNVEPGDLARSC